MHIRLSEQERIQQLDRTLVAIIQDFLVLTPLSWSAEVQHEFVSQAKLGNYTLPQVSYEQVDHTAKIEALHQYLRQLGQDKHPAIVFLRETAQSYIQAYHLLQGVGTKAVSTYSKILYGSPKDTIPGYHRRHIDVARYFLRVVDQYDCGTGHAPRIYTPEQVAASMRVRVGEVIDLTCDPIEVTIDEKIAARAAAGPNYVKIRHDAMFSDSDIEQLVHHEVLTHTLTYLNGRKQPILLSLGYSSPRVTATQEGLAVFSEYINMTIELVRLKRIALRIIAIDMAAKGADLVDLVRFFVSQGQPIEESYYSAMRTMRGGHPKGGIVFYKDNVYLRGLLEVESFLKRAMHQGRVQEIAALFIGKLTTHDAQNLYPLIEQGYVQAPQYMPVWAKKTSQLSAHLACNDITERFKVKGMLR